MTDNRNRDIIQVYYGNRRIKQFKLLTDAYECDIISMRTTFAWFTAAYKLNIQVTCNGAAVTVTNGTFTVAAGKEYEIAMQYVSGPARTGYLLIVVPRPVTLISLKPVRTELINIQRAKVFWLDHAVLCPDT